MRAFFNITPKGKVDITSMTVKNFLSENKVYKFFPSKHNSVIIQVNDNKVRILKKERLIELLFDYVDSFKFKNESQKEQVHNKLSKITSWIKSNVSHWLEETNLNFIGDTPKESFFFFNNCIVKVTADEITTHEYKEIEGSVYEEHIINKDFKLDQPSCITELEGPFHEFIYYLCWYDSDDFESLLSIIGFVIHRYKDPALAKAVIIYDTNVNMENPNGRCGKSLVCESFMHIRNFLKVDAKKIKPLDHFSFDIVELDTNGIVFDDIAKSLNFEKFFSLITGDLHKEEKFEKSLIIPFAVSPKIIFTSNYIVKGEGYSHEDRRIEFFISDFFIDKDGPKEHFGKRLFQDWNDDEYNQFHNTMVMAIQYYLKHGLVEPKLGRSYYLLKNSSPAGFIDKCKAYLLPGEKYVKSELFEEFKKDLPRLEYMSQYTFTSLLKKYADFEGWNVDEPHSNEVYYIMFLSNDKVEDLTEAEV